MKTIKKGFMIFLCFLIIFVTGCKSEETSQTESDVNYIEQKEASVYYSNIEGNNLVKKDVDISDVEKGKILNYLIDKALENPPDENIKSALRVGTECLNVYSDKSHVTIDLSKEFYNENHMSDILSLGALVKTVCSLNNVETVNILVENKPVTNSKGEEIGTMRDTDFVFDADALDSDEENITLYFSDESGEKLISEVRRIKIPKGEVMEKLVVSELIEGPKKEHNIATIPDSTKIISVETKEGVCFVNLSKDFIEKHPGGTTAESLTIYSVVNSLTELANVNKVQFLIDGEKKEIFKHVVFHEPFERDTSLIIK